MPKPFVSAEIEVRSVSTMNKVFARPDQETPFRIVVMGDFSGRGSSTSSEAASSRVVSKLRLLQVDCDNLDEVMKKLNVQTQLPIPGENGLPITLRFSELDDFHPDRIFQTEIFDRARKTRKRLSDPETFAATAMEVRDRLYPDITLESGKPPREPRPAASGFPAGGFLDQVIEETRAPSSAERPLGDSPAWTAFLEQIVRPHLVQNEDPAKLELLAAVDAASGDFMRAILHQPEFQTIEAAWRAMHFLVSRVETGSQVRLYMIDISKAELAADLRGKEDLTSTRLYSLLVKESIDIPGSDPWGLLAGVYMFDQTPEDVELLHCISRIANHAGAPFISAAGCRFIGCSSLAATPDPHDWRKEADSKGMQAWEELRKQPEAQYLGLALPRFLLRLPYGADTDPIELLDFEEMPAEPVHEHYLWGNPSVACAYLLAQAFGDQGWDLIPGSFQDIEGLPLHLHKHEGESRVKPCAEALLTMRAIEAILDDGFMPLVSYRASDTVRLARFQSVADPSTHRDTNLAGWWS